MTMNARSATTTEDPAARAKVWLAAITAVIALIAVIAVAGIWQARLSRRALHVAEQDTRELTWAL
jgi:hypothetical protein